MRSAAKVDPALIRYYFGTKKGLLRAAAVGLLDDIQERSRLVLDEPGPLRHRIRTRLQMLIDSLQRNPQFMNLVLKEIYSDEEAQMEVGDLNTVAKTGAGVDAVRAQPHPR
ncbi:TetR/AcrR family transcriptional regulator [Hydrogenophaga sp. UC242_50]|uniref:TetR/AcrR family transcriptional regulator n=1 Tax=Hydrogenophaga sp. UC242_50 TaxID=3350169 RepID=UPI0036D2B156